MASPLLLPSVLVNSRRPLKGPTATSFPTDDCVSLLSRRGGRPRSVDCRALCAFAGPACLRAGAAVAAWGGALCGAKRAGPLVSSSSSSSPAVARNQHHHHHHHRRPRPRFVGPTACAAAVRVIRDTLVVVEDADVALRVEDLGGRRRRVSGGIDIDASVARVWHVLTQYALMDKYMPNVVQSVTDVKDGQLYVDQIGIISRKLGLKTRMVMRVTETPSDLIAFSRVSGRDFSEFEGRYIFKPVSEYQMRLDYEVVAVPMPFFPVALVERKIVKEVPGMLASVRGEAMYGRVIPL
jgi:Polyketide cyclase / dehydrase and lipid transport